METPHRLTPDALRQTWLDFFAARGHALPPAAPLVPESDPTLLFTGAGMNQFKEYFLGVVEPPWRRAATVQPCFRQGDLENVGRTPRHLTFFEMLGHFSFGDYFKKEAIGWAWEFLTGVLRIPADRLWVTVYEKDEEAAEAWRALGLPQERIGRFDAKENFWPANAPAEGPDGVCGPCSEVFYDYGERFARGDGGPKAYDSGRFIEIWNSVFTQYERQGPEHLVPLPQRNIDCGVGFERVLAVLEGEYSMYGTSLFRPLMAEIGRIVGQPYPFPSDGRMPEGDGPRRMRRIADHVRSACFLVAAGVKPSNEGRGYVLRRVLRLAIRDGIQLGLEDPFLSSLVPAVVEVMKGGYPLLAEGVDVIQSALRTEEEQFRRTYAQGLRFLEAETQECPEGGTLAGEVAFKLYDTYGFPLDLAERILEERGITVERSGFDSAMRAQQERARAGSKIQGTIFAGGPLSDLRAKGVAPTESLCYDTPDPSREGPEGRGVAAEAKVVGLLVGDALVEVASSGDAVTVVLDRTPFYAESGGQVGDAGRLEAPGLAVEVTGTQAREGYVLHEARVVAGDLAVGVSVRALVDEERRDATRRNHTATHLLQAALRRVLGPGVRQEGSLVAPDYLRFDFNHPHGLEDEEIERIETLVNEWVVRNDVVATEVLPLEEAKAGGAISLFGEKYGDVVRVVSVESGSKELCGGTHVRRTGDIGSFRILAETNVAAGVRRIEAATGLGALRAMARDRHVVRDLTVLLKARPEEILGRVESLQDDVRRLRKAEEKARRDAGLGAVKRLVADAEEVRGLRVQVAALPGVDGKILRSVWDALSKGGVDVGVVIGESGGRAPVLAGCSPGALDRGLDARVLLEAATAVLGGRGGGRPELAQGQGQDAAKAPAAVSAVRRAVQEAAATG